LNKPITNAEIQPLENYKITKVPTTIFEVNKPKDLSDQCQNYEITKVPTIDIDLGNLSKKYIENVVKYSEPRSAGQGVRKRSSSMPRPPPPTFKPPPPPPLM